MLLRCAAVLLFLIHAGGGYASSVSIPDLQPKRYASPSGEMVLLVNPNQRSGAGLARYEVKRQGEIVWFDEHPFTLWDAAISDDGVVAGYGYSRGYQAFRDPGDFVVAILDEQGKQRLLETTPRLDSGYFHGLPYPQANAVLLDADNDRLIVRVRDHDVDTEVESWWTYRLSTGALIGKSQPKNSMPNDASINSILDARLVPGTPLVLTHWYRPESWNGPAGDQCLDDSDTTTVSDRSDDSAGPGARFTLVDLDYRPVWTLDLPDDYSAAEEDETQARLLVEIYEHGAILATGPDDFELRHVAANRRVSYHVAPDPESSDTWSVQQVASEPYRAKSPTLSARIPSNPELPLLLPVGTIELERSESDTSPIGDFYDFDMDDTGRFGFIRSNCDSDDSMLVVVDGQGQLVRSIPLRDKPDCDAPERHLLWLVDDDWLLTTSPRGRNVRASAVRIDITTGESTNLPDFDAPAIEALAATGDGGFVALTEVWSTYNSQSTLSAFDAHGRQRWTVEEDYRDDRKLFSPEDVAVTNEGDIVVLESIQRKLKIYERDGDYRATVDLEHSWGREPNYLTGLEADSDGGVIVNDFNGKPAIVHMRLDGTVLASFNPAFDDGRRFDIRGDVQVAEDGHLWTSDGHALLRLDDRGVVDRVLGKQPDTDALGEIAAMTIFGEGRIHAVDHRTGAVHVFDSSGQSIQVCRPDSSDYQGDVDVGSLSVSDDGGLLVSRRRYPDDFLQYSPDCRRVGVRSLKLDTVSQTWHAQPGSSNRWVVGYENLYLVDSDDLTLRTIERSSDGRWLQDPGPASVAPDGSIAVVSGASPLRAADADPPVVAFFSAAGDALNTWPMPDLISIGSNIAYDGKRVAFITDSGGDHTPDSVLVTDPMGVPIANVRPTSVPQEVFLVRPASAPEVWLFDGERIDRYEFPGSASVTDNGAQR